ncbi:MAG: GNAT family N-acetyltransferase [Methanobacterium sp.]|uniref:GNAT family N-acetyltransferase n=1 Tax=Methanobacterium sp. TaxID=2164 RepID=UPI003C7933F4
MINSRIRNVFEEDFMKISQLGEKCNPMINEREAIYHIFTKFFKNTSLVLEINNNIMGFLIGFISQENKENAYIHLLCVEKDLRRQNMASDLVKEFINIVSLLNCKKVFLVCKPSNKTAINFYNKMDFLSLHSDQTVIIDDINVFPDYDGPAEDKIVFYKFINR